MLDVARQELDDDARREAVLRAFVRADGSLRSIPARRSKRIVLLDQISQVFDVGVRYPERDVNALLRAFHPDVAALRRYLVDEEFLTRADSIYWRSGGTVVLLDETSGERSDDAD